MNIKIPDTTINPKLVILCGFNLDTLPTISYDLIYLFLIIHTYYTENIVILTDNKKKLGRLFKLEFSKLEFKFDISKLVIGQIKSNFDYLEKLNKILIRNREGDIFFILLCRSVEPYVIMINDTALLYNDVISPFSNINKTRKIFALMDTHTDKFLEFPFMYDIKANISTINNIYYKAEIYIINHIYTESNNTDFNGPLYKLFKKYINDYGKINVRQYIKFLKDEKDETIYLATRIPS